MKNMKIRTKYNLLMGIVILSLMLIICSIVAMQVKEAYREMYGERVSTDSQLGYKIIDQNFPGTWSVKNGQLYKGDEKINNNNDILEEIGEITGGAVTIFLGDTRVATNVKDEAGNRIIGTKADPKVTDAVLEKNETYLGEADIVGETYLTMYKPITDESGKVIGMWMVGPKISVISKNLSRIQIFISTICVLLGVSALFITAYFSRSIVRPIHDVHEQLMDIAEGEGDLSRDIAINSKDETGELANAFNKLLQTLRKMIQDISAVSEQVASSSEELLASSEQTTNATNQVVTSIQEVAHNVEIQGRNTIESANALSEITEAVQKMANSSGKVANSVNETTKQAHLGNDYIQKVMEQMNVIYESANETSTVMNDLENRSKEIGKIIEVITGISNQTNLLALNASIEAARAGEQGKGFSVVADEIRNLAEQSKDSASKITEIIKLIQKDTHKAAERAKNDIDQVDHGLKMVHETGNTFKEILQSITAINIETEELSAISEEISATIQELNASVEEITKLAENSTKNASEIAAASEEQLATLEEITSSAMALADMAEKLQELVQRFKI